MPSPAEPAASAPAAPKSESAAGDALFALEAPDGFELAAVWFSCASAAARCALYVWFVVVSMNCL